MRGGERLAGTVLAPRAAGAAAATAAFRAADVPAAALHLGGVGPVGEVPNDGGDLALCRGYALESVGDAERVSVGAAPRIPADLGGEHRG